MAQLQRPMAGRNAAALADLDFAKDDLVRIGWQADGPNFGTLRFKAPSYRCVVLSDLRWRPLLSRKAVREDRQSNQAWREVGVHDSLPT